ncbi:MAG: PAS domain-containing protein, partial [Myxococcales bacterium]|nr:PAS domain-containing protein [Myxococcales bacterium]
MADDELSLFFETCPSMLFRASGDGGLLRVSAALERRLGLLVGGSLLERVAAADRAALSAALGELSDAQDTLDLELRLFDPAGAPTLVRCLARRGVDGLLSGELRELPADAATRATASRDHRIERRLLRAIMENLDLVLWAIDADGVFVYHDGKGLAPAGLEPGQFLGLNLFDLYPPEHQGGIHDALAGKTSRMQSPAHGIEWDSWIVPLRGDDGAVEYVVGITINISEAARRELRLKEQIETIQAQQRAIHELSAPLIEVWDRVVTVPLIGVLDSHRAKDLMERLLTEVTRIGARHAILDLTGVE